MENVTGRVALVTGGAQGIGFQIGRALAEEGARVVLADYDRPALAKAEDEDEAGVWATGVATRHLDVRDRDAWSAVVEEIEATIGPISILCNNAGVAALWPLDDVTFELWDWALDINLGGVVNGVQTMLPRLRDRGEGYIVNTSSGAGLAYADSGAVYHASKFAVVGLSEAMHAELEPVGIGVSVLCPGPVATHIIDNSNRVRPPLSGIARPDRPSRLTDDQLKASMAKSTPPELVGPMVVAAMKRRQLYIHTDGYLRDILKDRTRAILADMPGAGDD